MRRADWWAARDLFTGIYIYLSLRSICWFEGCTQDAGAAIVQFVCVWWPWQWQWINNKSKEDGAECFFYGAQSRIRRAADVLLGGWWRYEKTLRWCDALFGLARHANEHKFWDGGNAIRAASFSGWMLMVILCTRIYQFEIPIKQILLIRQRILIYSCYIFGDLTLTIDY